MIDGKVALVTAVSGGIGRAVLLHLAPRVSRVFTANRRDVIASWSGAGSWPANATHVVSDLTREADVAALLGRIQRDHGRLDILVNCAGGSLHAHSIEQFPVDAFDEVIAVNLRSAFLLTKHAIPLMRAGGGGNIVHLVSSSTGRISPGKAPYAAAKAGLVRLIQQAAVEVAPAGIVVNGVSPCYVFTERHERELDASARDQGMGRETIVERVLAGQVLKAPVHPGDLLPVIELLATTRVITGQVYDVSAGETVH